MTPAQCPDCGARYFADDDSCADRFNSLLALDHSRREPWGSRHGQAFAAFALQHPSRFSTSLDRAWTALYRIYCLNERPTDVFPSIRAAKQNAGVPPRPPRTAAPSVTIADLGDFAAATYAARLDAWCIATLRVYGQTTPVPPPEA
jgi:hypothetical protein